MMKKQLIILAMFVTAFHIGIAQTPSHTPKAGFVPNAETAVRVAEAVLIPVYGEKHILSERPFKATLDGACGQLTELWFAVNRVSARAEPHK